MVNKEINLGYLKMLTWLIVNEIVLFVGCILFPRKLIALQSGFAHHCIKYDFGNYFDGVKPILLILVATW